ncbi:MAG: GAF domain-containing protein, partial [Pseudomonadota bacterium]
MDTSEPLLWPIGTDPSADYSAEEERLATLASFVPDELTDDPELKRIAQFAAQLCRTESAAISLVEAERQLFIASTGLTANETPRSTSFCAKAMLKGHILEVPDASEDPRFKDYALVTGPAH